MAIIETLFYVLFKLILIIIKCGLIYTILVTCHQGLEDDRHGSINQRSISANFMISLLFVILSLTGIYGVYMNHLGLFLTWFLLRPIVYILDLESTLWTTIAMAIIASGGTLCAITYESIGTLAQTVM
jgi:hypothetical protein